MNVMMEIKDQAMDAIQHAESREDGAVLEEILGLKTSVLLNVKIGDTYIESIVMTETPLMVMDVVQHASKKPDSNVEVVATTGKMYARKYAEMEELQDT